MLLVSLLDRLEGSDKDFKKPSTVLEGLWMTVNSKFGFSWHQPYFSNPFFIINSHVIKVISFSYNPLYFYYIKLLHIDIHFSYYVVPFIILCTSKKSILMTSQIFHYTYYFFKLNSLDIMAISYMYYVSPFIILPCT